MLRPARIALALAAALGLAGLASGQLAANANALEPPGANDCAAQVWPQIDPQCLVADGGPARAVRVVDPADADAPPPVLVRLPTAG